MPLTFEWNKNKTEKNKKKHNITFEEASTIFSDFLSITVPDPIHSNPDEERFVTIGMSYRQNLLIVVHCDYGNKIRIISARKTTKRERIEYENK